MRCRRFKPPSVACGGDLRTSKSQSCTHQVKAFTSGGPLAFQGTHINIKISNQQIIAKFPCLPMYVCMLLYSLKLIKRCNDGKTTRRRTQLCCFAVRFNHCACTTLVRSVEHKKSTATSCCDFKRPLSSGFRNTLHPVVGLSNNVGVYRSLGQHTQVHIDDIYSRASLHRTENIGKRIIHPLGL